MKSNRFGIQVISVLMFCSAAGATVINGTVNMDFTDIAAGDVGYGYKIGVQEVSVAQYEASGLHLTDTGKAYNYYGSGDTTPVVGITWHEAAQYCNWLTSGSTTDGAYTISGSKVTAIKTRAEMLSSGQTYYVLPTQDEWFNAAYVSGTTTQLYSTVGGGVPTAEVDAVYNRTFDGYPPSSTPWSVADGTLEINGTKNMMGNVWEWQESAVSGVNDPSNDSQMMSFQGGDWFLGTTKLRSDTFSQDERGNDEYNIGMRIVAIPEPGTISLMSLSTLGILFTRTVRRRRMVGRSLLPVRERACDVFESDVSHEICVDEEESFVREYVWEKCQSTWSAIGTFYRGLDKRFWDHMVSVHERRITRREALRTSAKTRFLNGLDAVLARIMK